MATVTVSCICPFCGATLTFPKPAPGETEAQVCPACGMLVTILGISTAPGPASLYTPDPVIVDRASILVGTRPTLNFIPTATVGIAAVDDPAGNKVDLTFTAAGALPPGAEGDFLLYTLGAWAAFPPGAASFFLQSNGPGFVPGWVPGPAPESLNDAYNIGAVISGAGSDATAVGIGNGVADWGIWADATLAQILAAGATGALVGWNAYFDTFLSAWVQPAAGPGAAQQADAFTTPGSWGWYDYFVQLPYVGTLARLADGMDLALLAYDNAGVAGQPRLTIGSTGNLALNPLTGVIDSSAARYTNAQDPVNPQDLVTLSYAGAHYSPLPPAGHNFLVDDGSVPMLNNDSLQWLDAGAVARPVLKMDAANILEIEWPSQLGANMSLNNWDLTIPADNTSSIADLTHSLTLLSAREVFSTDVLNLACATTKYIKASHAIIITNAAAWEGYAFADGDVIILGAFTSAASVNINKQVAIVGPGAGKCTIKCSAIGQYVSLRDVTIVPDGGGCTFGNCNSYYGCDFAAGTFTFSGDTNSVFDNCSFAGASLNFVSSTLNNCMFTATTFALVVGSYCTLTSCSVGNFAAGASTITVPGSYSTLAGFYTPNPSWPSASLIAVTVSGSHNILQACLFQRCRPGASADLSLTVSGSYNVLDGCSVLEEDLTNNGNLIRAVLVSGSNNTLTSCSFACSPQAGAAGACTGAEISGNYNALVACIFDASNGGAANSLGLQIDGGATDTQVTSPRYNATVTVADAGAGTIIQAGTVTVSQQIISSLATGTSPLSVASTTVNANFNADMVDGVHAGGLATNPMPNATWLQWVKAGGGNQNVLELDASNYIELGYGTQVDGDLWVGTSSVGQNEDIYATYGANVAPVMDAGHWTAGADWTFAGGVATHAATGSSTLHPTVSLAPTIGVTYQVSFALSGYAAGSVTMTLGGIVGAIQTFNGTYTVLVTALTTGNLIFAPTATFVGGISAVTVETIAQGLLTVGRDVAYSDIYGNPASLATLTGRLSQMQSDSLLDKSGSALSCAGGVLTYTLTAVGGEMGFDLGGLIYPVTTGTYSVALTGGTDANPVTNYVYFVLGGGGVPTLTVATSYPANLYFITVATFIVGAVAGANYTCYGYNHNRMEIDNFVSRVISRFYEQGTLYVSGYVPTVTAPITLSIAAAGSFFNGIFQMTSNNAVTLAGGYYWVDSAGAYHASTLLSDLNQYADGSAVPANGRVNIVWGVVPTSTTAGGTVPTVVKLFAVLMSPPGSTYTTDVSCEQDAYAVTNYFPPDPVLQKIFVPVIRTIVRPSTPSFNAFSSGAFYKDLRGKITSGGGSSTPVDLSSLIPKNVLVEQGDLIYAAAAATPTNLAPGSFGQPLLTHGAAANPAWSANTYHFATAADWEAYLTAGGAAGDQVFLGAFTSTTTEAITHKCTIVGVYGSTTIKLSAVPADVTVTGCAITGAACTYGGYNAFYNCSFSGTHTFTGAVDSEFSNCYFAVATCAFTAAHLANAYFTAALASLTVNSNCQFDNCSAASSALAMTVPGSGCTFNSFFQYAAAVNAAVAVSGADNVLNGCTFTAIGNLGGAGHVLLTVTGNNNVFQACNVISSDTHGSGTSYAVKVTGVGQVLSGCSVLGSIAGGTGVGIWLASGALYCSLQSNFVSATTHAIQCDAGANLNALVQNDGAITDAGTGNFKVISGVWAHEAQHVTGGTDIIPTATPGVVGLAPAVAAPAAAVLNVVGIANGETVLSGKALFDATNPAALGAVAPGTSLLASHEDHIHPMPSAADVGALAQIGQRVVPALFGFGGGASQVSAYGIAYNMPSSGSPYVQFNCPITTTGTYVCDIAWEGDTVGNYVVNFCWRQVTDGTSATWAAENLPNTLAQDVAYHEHISTFTNPASLALTAGKVACIELRRNSFADALRVYCIYLRRTV